MKCCPIFYANLPMSIQFCACLQKSFSCEFYECRRSKGTSLRNINEFLSLLCTFICHLGEIRHKRAAHYDVELLWVLRKSSRRKLYLHVCHLESRVCLGKEYTICNLVVSFENVQKQSSSASKWTALISVGRFSSMSSHPEILRGWVTLQRIAKVGWHEVS